MEELNWRIRPERMVELRSGVIDKWSRRLLFTSMTTQQFLETHSAAIEADMARFQEEPQADEPIIVERVSDGWAGAG